MEGLIPMVYKAMKRSRTRRQYRSLSTSSIPASSNDYDIADFYTDHNQISNYIYVPSAAAAAAAASSSSHDHHRLRVQRTFNANGTGPAPESTSGDNQGVNKHRRHKSSAPVSVSHDQQQQQPPPSAKQLVRFRSHRRFLSFSCITGAATATASS